MRRWWLIGSSIYTDLRSASDERLSIPCEHQRASRGTVHQRLAHSPGRCPTVQNIQTRVSAIRAFYASCATNVSGVGSILAPNMTVSAEFVTDVSSQAQFAISWAALNTGAYGQVAPTRLALAVNWKTGTAARRARGRTF